VVNGKVIKIDDTVPAARKRAPAVTPEQRNNQLIDKAYDAAERMIDDGKATSQLLTHFLKQGTTRDELEIAKLTRENLLLEARTQQIASSEDTRALYEEAIKVMTEYKGEADYG
jgi:hypothetical protein